MSEKHPYSPGRGKATMGWNVGGRRSTAGAGLLVLGGLILGLSGCGGDSEPPPADQRLAALEETLLTAPLTELDFRIVAEGAFTAELDGTLTLEGEDWTRLLAAGHFGGEPVDLYLEGEEGILSGGRRDGAGAIFNRVAPPALKEALVVGMVRMGLLHNLARLVSGAPPDGGDGGAGGWVLALDPEWVDGGLRFQIQVGGEAAGEATLEFDAEGRWVARHQVVRFPGGEMQVREEYRFR